MHPRSILMWERAHDLTQRDEEVMVVLGNDYARDVFMDTVYASPRQIITTMADARGVLKFVNGTIKHRFNPRMIVLIDPAAIEQHYGAILTEYLRYGEPNASSTK